MMPTSKALPIVASKKMLEAMDQTIEAYDKLIADPQRWFPAWYTYGDVKTCRLCLAAKPTPESILEYDCSVCPLGEHKHMGCDTISLKKLQTFIRSRALLDPSDEDELKALARTRRSWLLRKFKPWRSRYAKA